MKIVDLIESEKIIDRRQHAFVLYPLIKQKPYPTHEFNKLSDKELRLKKEWEIQYDDANTVDLKRRNEATKNLEVINKILAWREKVKHNEMYNKNKQGYVKLEENLTVKEADFLSKILKTLEKYHINVEPEWASKCGTVCKLNISKAPRLNGVVTVKDGKVFVVVQGYKGDIDLGEMDVDTLGKDLNNVNTKKWFRENDKDYDD